MPISLGTIEVLALVDWAELEEAQSGAALGAVTAQTGRPLFRVDHLGGCLGKRRGGKGERGL